MEKQSTKQEKKQLHIAIIKQMIMLSISGFGVVSALAWNNVIKEVVDVHVKPFLPQGSGVISLLLYAILITALGVTVTYQLTKIAEKLE